MKKINKSIFSLSKNNFWIGLGSIFNIFGNYFMTRPNKDALQADINAIASDWWAVGNDIRKVIGG